MMPMYVTRPIRHDRDHLHRALPPPRHQTPRPRGLSLGTYTIWEGQGPGITQAIRAARNCGFDLMIMTETKITYQSYCRTRMGYDVV